MAHPPLLVTAACAGLISAAAALSAHAEDFMPSDKCYGIAKAGQNACGSATGMHACAGAAKVDRDPGDWVNMPAEECAKQGGKTTAPSK